MMSFITSVWFTLSSVWFTLCELAPWLLLGMGLSGLLHVTLPASFVRQKLRGFSGVLKSVAIGVPLPLCSCGVIPAGIGLKKDGASSGAAVGFLISTPQTGVDSILVSASFFGWPFAVFKLITAAVMGVVGGVWIDRKSLKSANAATEIDAATCNTDAEAGHKHAHNAADRRGWSHLVPHAIDMLRSIWVWLVVGILVSALINQFDIAPLTERINQWGLLPAMLLVLLFSIPLYVCATASVPIAAALVSSGLPPAVALVFLMAGPATNVATMGAIRSNLGTRALAIYLLTIVVGSMGSAYLFDSLVAVTATEGIAHVHNVNAWWAQLSGGIVLGLIAMFVWEKINRAMKPSIALSDLSSRTIAIDGMSCGNCVQKLEALIEKQAGVESVHVSLADGRAIIVGDFDLESLKQKINESGFVPH